MSIGGLQLLQMQHVRAPHVGLCGDNNTEVAIECIWARSELRTLGKHTQHITELTRRSGLIIYNMCSTTASCAELCSAHDKSGSAITTPAQHCMEPLATRLCTLSILTSFRWSFLPGPLARRLCRTPGGQFVHVPQVVPGCDGNTPQTRLLRASDRAALYRAAMDGAPHCMLHDPLCPLTSPPEIIAKSAGVGALRRIGEAVNGEACRQLWSQVVRSQRPFVKAPLPLCWRSVHITIEAVGARHPSSKSNVER